MKLTPVTNHSLKTGLSALVPQESDAEIVAYLTEENDESGLWLYNLTKIRSCDVDFTWRTGMLMHQIGTWAMDAETLDDFVRALKYYRHGKILYQKCKKHVREIFDYFHEHPME